jgi:hypothetical protein
MLLVDYIPNGRRHWAKCGGERPEESAHVPGMLDMVYDDR